MGTQTGVADAGASTAADGDGHLTGYGTKAYRSYVLNALLFVYILNFLDRGLLGIVAKPVMDELQISRGDFGLLTGIGFALFYSVVGIPLARFAEHGHRVWIMTICIALWSAATALSGMVAPVEFGGVVISGFIMLLICRVLVGVEVEHLAVGAQGLDLGLEQGPVEGLVPGGLGLGKEEGDGGRLLRAVGGV